MIAPALFLRFDFWLMVLGALLMLRQLVVVLAAEQGRKHDLVRKLYDVNTDFRVAVLVPYLDPADCADLFALLGAINAQDYPADHVTVHLAVSPEARKTLSDDMLGSSVRLWQCPQSGMRDAHVVDWLIERCLAAGEGGMMVFLRPTDMIKPDFVQNLVACGADSFAVQGYVALKSLDGSPLSNLHALGLRLMNRIGNAGRYHLGLSCRMLDSGWAVRQEVIEMIPYRRGDDPDNFEYTLRLNLENFRVTWAPTLTVYVDARQTFWNRATLRAAALCNRVSLLFRYGPRLVARGFRGDFNALEQWLTLVKPPQFSTLLVLIALAVLDATASVHIAGSWKVWAFLALGTMLLQGLAMAVARCKPQDYLTLALFAPVFALGGLLTFPFALARYAFAVLGHSDGVLHGVGSRPLYRQRKATRFNEELAPAPSLYTGQNALDSLLADADETALGVYAGESPPQQAREPREHVKSVRLSNGAREIHCLLRTLTTFEGGRESYRLTLEHKSLAFSTAAYHILDQAFYELETKLRGRGLTIVTCGSCGHFFNPTADVPGALKNAGVCLYGKEGRQINLNTDAVTVLSQPCQQHCALEERESIVRRWKDSLANRPTPRSRVSKS